MEDVDRRADDLLGIDIQKMADPPQQRARFRVGVDDLEIARLADHDRDRQALEGRAHIRLRSEMWFWRFVRAFPCGVPPSTPTCKKTT